MKRVIAVIRPNKLDDVIYAFQQIEDFPGATITEVRGMGRGFSRRIKDTRQASPFDFPTQVRIEVVCTEERLAEIVSAIARTAKTGKSGDGKIFISSVDEVIRISSGQQGDDAIL